MSVSLVFPTLLSDIIVAKGIGHLEPKWNFSLENDKLSINLTWEHLPNQSLVLSPPPPLVHANKKTEYPGKTFNQPHHRLFRNEVPPRFQNKYRYDKWEKTDQSETLSPSSSVFTSPSLNVHNHSESNYMRDTFGNLPNICNGHPVESMSDTLPSSFDTCVTLPLDNIRISNTDSLSSNHSIFDDSNSNISVLHPCSDKHANIGDTYNETENKEVKSTLIDNSPIPAYVETSEVEVDSIGDDLVSHDVTEPTDDSNQSPLEISDFPVHSEIQEIIDHDISDDLIGHTIGEKDIPTDVTDFSPPILGKGASRECVDQWVRDMETLIRGDDIYASIVDATWTRSEKTKDRGMGDDPSTGCPGSLRCLHLNAMFDVIGDACPLSKGYIRRSSTCLKRIWALVYTHYGYKMDCD